MKTTLLIALWLTCAGLAQPVTRLEGKVWSLEDQAVYFTTSDNNAVKAPRNATFLRQGQPVPPSDLKTGDAITVIYPSDDFEIFAGPYPPNVNRPYSHRTIRRGPTSLDQDFREGQWVDRSQP